MRAAMIPKQYSISFANCLFKLKTNLLNNIGEVRSIKGTPQLPRLHAKSVLALTQKDFLASFLKLGRSKTSFKQSFARLFVAYRDAYLAKPDGSISRRQG